MVADEPSNSELGRGQERHERDITRLEQQVAELRDLVHTLERRLILSVVVPVVVLIVTVILTFVRPV